MNQAFKRSSQLGSKFFVYAALIVFLWGTAFTLVDIAVQDMSPIWLVTARTLIAAVLVTAWCYGRGSRLPPLSDKRWRYYLAFGIVGVTLPFWLLSVAQMHIDSGLAAIIVSIMPLATVILAHFFSNEPLTARKLLGFFLGFIGIAYLFLPDDLSWGLILDWPYQLLAIGAALCYASTTVAVKYLPPTPSTVGAAMMLICAAIIAIPLAFLEGIPQHIPRPDALWATLGLALGGSALGTILYLHLTETYGPSLMAKINYFPPLVSIAAGIWWLNEPFEWRFILAFLIILIGILIARPQMKTQTPPR